MLLEHGEWNKRQSLSKEELWNVIQGAWRTTRQESLPTIVQAVLKSQYIQYIDFKAH